MSIGADFARAHGEQLRLAVLQLLAETPGYRAADGLLHPALDALGLPCTRDQLRTHIGWLAEQDLIRADRGGSAIVAVLTERGGDVARGQALVDGVARPTPGR